MQKLKYPLVALCIIYLFLIFLVSCAKPHQVEFLSQACIVPVSGYEYKTCEPIVLIIDQERYVIPKDFETDLASIPRLLWPVLSPRYTSFVEPAILHDYLYQCAGFNNRKYADEILYSALLSKNVTKFTAIKFYIGVRLFGAFHYNNSFDMNCMRTFNV